MTPQLRALALAADCRIDGERFTVRRPWDRTPDLSGPERLAVFGALPTWAQDDFYADVEAGGSPR